MPTNIFISYSHQDESWKDLVVKYLKGLGDSSVDIWNDRRIGAGQDWSREIKLAIQQAKIAVLLVSIDFLNSDFIQKKEIPALLKKRQEEGIKIIPFIVRPCPWKLRIPWLKEILARPKDGKPLSLSSLPDQEAILDIFAEEIYSFLPGPETKSTPITPSYVDIAQSLPDQIIELLQTGTYKEALRVLPTDIGNKHQSPNHRHLPAVVIQRLLSEGYLNISSKGQTSADEVNYEYQAKRFGMGYRFFNVKCDIEKDGSASVIRTVELEAYSLLREIDTTIQIPEQDPDGKYRDIEIGKIISFDEHELTLDPIERKPGQVTAKINIKPALKRGEKLKYQVSDYYLEKGLFAIGLNTDEHSKRKTPDDYFGWNISRPTKSFILQIQFPFGNLPKQYWHEVRYSTSSTLPDKGIQLGEQRRLRGPENDPLKNPDNLRLEVSFPLSGLVYLIGWKPLLIAER